ncbi:acyl-protein thioesterase [Stachybotrys elegans]|uniref:Acyl-protein thioesterase n=1 Tax=Stachybotrys elegans TaxID=80388 RepID=A0A8K0WWB1_9HYPO|nr:acyl-protein thioesterase [Stachybotrys elegans]
MPGQSEPRRAGHPPFVVEPQAAHTHTLILLHGLGSDGHKFGSELLRTAATGSGATLPALLPGARFVFPTARPRRSAAFGRAVLTSWFDIADLRDPSLRRERQLRGLAESAADILEILHEEVQIVKPENIIFGGLSQGCAMSLAVLLSLEFPLGGYIGMSGFITFQPDLHEALLPVEAEPDDLFERDEEDSAHPAHPSVKAQALQRELLEMEAIEAADVIKTAHRTPILLGHGEEDEKISCHLGLAAAQVMRDAGYVVSWKSYANQGHWYKIPDQVEDWVEFIVSTVGWEVSA